MNYRCRVSPALTWFVASLVLGLMLCPRLPAAPQAAPGLTWEAHPAGRQASLFAPGPGKPGFSLMSPETTGVRFTNWLSEDRHLTNQILLNGSGVAAGDIDGDGWCDLYFCGLDGPNRLFRNLGNWKFEDVTAAAGVGCDGMDAAGATFADLDGDGDLDLVVSTVLAGTLLFFNDGKGHFTGSPTVYNRQRCGSSVALADIDGDGDLDIYVANYRSVTIRDQPNTQFAIKTLDGRPQVVSMDGRPMTEPDLQGRFNFQISTQEGQGRFSYEENGEPDLLLRNDGQGKFTALSYTDGTFLDENGRPLEKPLFDWGLSVAFRDLNGDLAPDIYVCNDFKSPDRIWINDGHGRFRALSPLALREISLSSMGVDFADLNRDGFDDFLVVDMLSRDHLRRLTQRTDMRPEPSPIGGIANRPQVARNTLFLNRGDGTWAECAQFSGLEASEWSWCPIFLDVDLDGYEDLLISNGFERDGMNVDVLRRLEAAKKMKKLPPLEQLRLRKMFPRLNTANLAFRNGGHLQFQDMSEAWGFNQQNVSQGMCLADLDNDGDLDVIVNNLNGPADLFRNTGGGQRICVRLQGLAPNTHGIGARIKVSGGPVAQSQEMQCGGRYLSSDDTARTFAAGAGDMTVEVLWRDGRRSVVTGAKAGRAYEIHEQLATSATPSHPVAPAQPALLFTDRSELIQHRHRDEPFDDFALQPMLTHRLSQLGPGVSWFDVDGDGWEDLILGSGRGGRMAVYRNDGRAGFALQKNASLRATVNRDQTSVLGWRKPDGTFAVVAGLASYEDGQTNSHAVVQVSLESAPAEPLVTDHESSAGPLAMADLDGDGGLDLFVGGRVIHGRYPEPASSRMFRGRGGRFEPDRENTAVLAGAGMVSGAVMSDLNGDGNVDLVLACSWGPIRVFQNRAGRLVEVTTNLGLARFTGWWNGVTTGDFDGDGRMDIAASNWGRNTRYESFRGQPLRVYYHTSQAGEAGIAVIEGYQEAGTGRVLPLQPFHLIGTTLPAVRERLDTATRYASLTLPEIYAEEWPRLSELQAATLESMVFLNRGDHFEGVPLPLEAQLAPAFAVCAADLDGDGHEDLFLSQNFFATHPETSRYDAGRGLLLLGDGHGGFRPISGEASGLRIYGEQRGAALGDYDGDGRVDLVVGQNAAETKLYQNTGARPGLRVRLTGPRGNPLGIAAQLRWVKGTEAGPVRESHAGSGYWSQNSAVQVLRLPADGGQLQVRWPGGKLTTSDVPPGTREASIDVTGALKVLR